MRDVMVAFKAKLDGGTADSVYSGEAPNNPPASYFVINAAAPRPGDRSAAATSKSRFWRFVVMYVGTSPESCLFKANEADAALLDKRLTVTGFNCSPMKREAGRPIAREPALEGVWSGVDTWTFVTTPA